MNVCKELFCIFTVTAVLLCVSGVMTLVTAWLGTIPSILLAVLDFLGMGLYIDLAIVTAMDRNDKK